MNGYFIEWNGEFWQSVFPPKEAQFSELHTSLEDAKAYILGLRPEATPVVVERAS